MNCCWMISLHSVHLCSILLVVQLLPHILKFLVLPVEPIWTRIWGGRKERRRGKRWKERVSCSVVQTVHLEGNEGAGAWWRIEEEGRKKQERCVSKNLCAVPPFSACSPTSETGYQSHYRKLDLMKLYLTVSLFKSKEKNTTTKICLRDTKEMWAAPHVLPAAETVAIISQPSSH